MIVADVFALQSRQEPVAVDAKDVEGKEGEWHRVHTWPTPHFKGTSLNLRRMTMALHSNSVIF